MSDYIYRIIDNFYNDIVERLSNSYKDEILKMFDNLPKSIIHFNDIEMLKKAQLYVRHTDRLFGKAIARLFCSMFNTLDLKSNVSNDRIGKCVYVRQKAVRFHFMNLEKVAGFPHVPWLNKMSESKNSNQIMDEYVLLTEKDCHSLDYIHKLNSHLENKSRHFICFEDFVLDNFSQGVWDYLVSAFDSIEQQAKTYQWFELVSVCNDVSLNKLAQEAEQTILRFDYNSELFNTGIDIDTSSFEIMKSHYLQQKAYKHLLESYDFSKSLLTSEWLYKNHSINGRLDNSFFVIGYIKSVEQLLCWIISGFPTDYSISINTVEGLRSVSLDSPEFFNATLGNMLYFLKDFENRKIYNSGIGNYAIKGLYLIIQSWVQNERNGYFHKNNLYKTDIVDQIRKRTFLVYFLLLGSINLEI